MERCLVRNLAIRVDNSRTAIGHQCAVVASHVCANHPHSVLEGSGYVDLSRLSHKFRVCALGGEAIVRGHEQRCCALRSHELRWLRVVRVIANDDAECQPLRPEYWSL